MQREPSSSDSRGGRSQTWPRAESWRAVVWLFGHWSAKVWRRVAKDMGEMGFMVDDFAAWYSWGLMCIMWSLVAIDRR
jgi:hypothetical protein